MDQLFDPASYHFSGYAVPVAFVGALNWLLGIATVRRERGSTPSKTLLLMTLAIGVWLMGLAAAYSTDDEGVARIWIRLSMAGTAFVPVTAFLHAVMGTSRLRMMRAFLVAGCWLSTTLATLALTSNLIVDDIHRYFWGYYPRYQSVGLVLIPYYAIFFVAGGILYRMGHRNTNSVTHRKRMRLRFAALMIAMPATLDFLPTLGIGIYPAGYVFISGYISIATYIIWRYRLVDITPALAAGQIIETMVEGLLVVDRDGIVRVANSAAERFAGAPKGLVETRCRDIEAAWGDDVLTRLLDPSRESHAELTYRTDDGGRSVVIASSKLQDHLGEWVGTVYSIHDITERKRSEQALRESEGLYRALVETSPDAVIVTEENGQIVMVNERAFQLTGIAPGADVGQRNAVEFIAPDDRGRLRETLTGAAAPDAVVARAAEYELLRADGSRVPVELSISTIPGADGGRRVMAIARDISERKLAEEKIRYLAFHDALTGAATRPMLLDRLNHALAQARRSGSSVGVIFVDLDGFKNINDTHGHEAGDVVLLHVAEQLSATLREGDTLARVGGDEFVLLFPSLQSAEEIGPIADRVIRQLAGHQPAKYGAIGASLGVATYPADGADAGTLLRNADRAMYAAKKSGGSRSMSWAECAATAGAAPLTPALTHRRAG